MSQMSQGAMPESAVPERSARGKRARPAPQLLVVGAPPPKRRASTFDDDKYAEVGTLEVQEDDGRWRPATLFRPRKRRVGSQIVIWFGGVEYEGIGGDVYTWWAGVLRDADKDVIPQRSFHATARAAVAAAPRRKRKPG